MLSSRKSYTVISLIVFLAAGCGKSNTSPSAPMGVTGSGDDSKPKSATPKSEADKAFDKKLDLDLAELDRHEKKREAQLNHRISERRRRRIYFDVKTALNDGLANPTIPGHVKASMDTNVADVCQEYHVSTDDADCIRTEGDTAGWPEPP